MAALSCPPAAAVASWCKRPGRRACSASTSNWPAPPPTSSNRKPTHRPAPSTNPLLLLAETAARDRLGKGHKVEIKPLSSILERIKQRQALAIARCGDGAGQGRLAWRLLCVNVWVVVLCFTHD